MTLFEEAKTKMRAKGWWVKRRTESLVTFALGPVWVELVEVDGGGAVRVSIGSYGTDADVEIRALFLEDRRAQTAQDVVEIVCEGLEAMCGRLEEVASYARETREDMR